MGAFSWEGAQTGLIRLCLQRAWGSIRIVSKRTTIKWSDLTPRELTAYATTPCKAEARRKIKKVKRKKKKGQSRPPFDFTDYDSNSFSLSWIFADEPLEIGNIETSKPTPSEISKHLHEKLIQLRSRTITPKKVVTKLRKNIVGLR